MKRGRRLSQTRRGMVARRWPIMRWYHEWIDFVRKQHRFKRWIVHGRAWGRDVKVAELWEFDRKQWEAQ